MSKADFDQRKRSANRLSVPSMDAHQHKASIQNYVREQARDAPDAFATVAFKRLQRQWYERLEREGFVDAEVRSITGYDSRLPTEYDRGMPREQYYRLAGWWLHDRVFPSRLVKRAWEYHGEGMPFRDIVDALRPMLRAGDPRYLCRLVRREAAALVAHYIRRTP